MPQLERVTIGLPLEDKLRLKSILARKGGTLTQFFASIIKEYLDEQSTYSGRIGRRNSTTRAHRARYTKSDLQPQNYSPRTSGTKTPNRKRPV